jgi:hypothetical protein
MAIYLLAGIVFVLWLALAGLPFVAAVFGWFD